MDEISSTFLKDGVEVWTKPICDTINLSINGETMARKVLNKINVKLKFLYKQATFLNPTCKRLLCNALIQPHFNYRKTVL